MIVLRQKIFFLGLNGEAISGEELLKQKKANGGSLKSNLDNLKLDKGIQAEKATVQRAAERAAGKANHNVVANAAKNARTAGYNAGKIAGAKNVGVLGGAKNTWAGMSKMGKAGAVGAGLVGAGLMAKGLFGGNKKSA